MEELRERRNAMIAALWANSNYDSESDPEIRANLAMKIEESFHKEIVAIVTGKRPDEEEIDKSNPFFGAMEKRMPDWSAVDAAADQAEPGLLDGVDDMDREFVE